MFFPIYLASLDCGRYVKNLTVCNLK